MEHNKSKGDKGEDIAVDLLVSKGYDIVERNFRNNRGEIDIVARDRDYLVFVEVKTRQNYNFGEPELAITKNKVKQLRKMAEAYLYENMIRDVDCRFDIIAIVLIQGEKPRINHIINAIY